MEIPKKELYETIEKLLLPDSTIGLHGIKLKHNNDTLEENMSRVFNILDNGLEVKSTRHRGLYGTVQIVGNIKEDRELLKECFKTYRWTDSVNFIIISIPQEVQCIDGRKLYLGIPDIEEHNIIDSPNPDPNYSYDDIANTCLADVILEQNVPNEFIIGNYRWLNGDNVNLTLNKNYAGFKDGKISINLFNELEERIKRWQDINDVDEKNDLPNYVLYKTKITKEKYIPTKIEYKMDEKTKKILDNPDSLEQFLEDTTFSLKELIKGVLFKGNLTREEMYQLLHPNLRLNKREERKKR